MSNRVGEAIQREVQSLKEMPKSQWGTGPATQRLYKILNLVADFVQRVQGTPRSLISQAKKLSYYYHKDALGPTTLTDRTFERLKGICARIFEEVRVSHGQRLLENNLQGVPSFHLPSLANAENRPVNESSRTGSSAQASYLLNAARNLPPISGAENLLPLGRSSSKRRRLG